MASSVKKQILSARGYLPYTFDARTEDLWNVYMVGLALRLTIDTDLTLTPVSDYHSPGKDNEK